MSMEVKSLNGQWAGVYTLDNSNATASGESEFFLSFESDLNDRTRARINGQGFDDAGSFTIAGTLDSKDLINLQKNYSTRGWTYAGKLDRALSVVHGSWGDIRNGPMGFFAFQQVDDEDVVSAGEKIRRINGRWKGTYSAAREDTRWPCEFELTVSPGNKQEQLAIVGKGLDSAGAYWIKGMVLICPPGDVC
ncbi:hypothetical protein BDV32DRAFT_147516 [Aspergillus pseudonomiae]|uniref:Uncharacterized protein n=1 Tax=Aspergillus pseudonomiae TaxID=1506151 RepID=A0A5N7CXZ9_9EURO|nr:uncharacterized protein BDV37DRAFT_276103 [Aspergillus pseudonomiae]KAB8262595.1 hypothetical protein BDV32DRAFT_147516 [Aspergillus pseudonomiae]KAE8398443.1 hypothetical protein BDV37DRAFT_276103 [Aspergillus pseudonomiae]